MQPPPKCSNLSQAIAAPPLPQPDYTEQFAKNKEDSLKGPCLRDWEQAALRSYRAFADIRQSLGLCFFLLSLNAVIRVVLMQSASPALKPAMMFELFGFNVVGVLGLITFFRPRWWMVMTTAIAIFPLALGIITGLMAVGLLCMVPMLRRANRELYLSASDYDATKSLLSEIATGKQAEAWPEIGKVGIWPVRVGFYENAALFLLKDKPLNTILNNDAARCVVEITKQNQKVLKKWPSKGKLKNIHVALTEEGHTRLQHWLAKVAAPPVAASA